MSFLTNGLDLVTVCCRRRLNPACAQVEAFYKRILLKTCYQEEIRIDDTVLVKNFFLKKQNGFVSTS